MTLHWWMHWFWVTVQIISVLASPLPSTTEEPRGVPGKKQDYSTTSSTSSSSSIITSTLSSVETLYPSTVGSVSRQSFRVPKAIGLHPQSNPVDDLNQRMTTLPVSHSHQNPTYRSTQLITSVQSIDNNNNSNKDRYSNNSGSDRDSDNMNNNSNNNNNNNNNTDSTVRSNYLNQIDKADSVRNGSVTTTMSVDQSTIGNVEIFKNHISKKDSKLTRRLITNKSTKSSKYSEMDNYKPEEDTSRNSSIDDDESLTVLPLTGNNNRFRLVLNKTQSFSELETTIGNNRVQNSNRSEDDIEIDDELSEPQLIATAASVVEVGVGESTRLGFSRSRSAFTSNFKREQRIQENNHSTNHNENTNEEDLRDSGDRMSSKSVINIAAITATCLATIALLSTMGSLGFIMYRRRYLNPPQTLNSDKCSNQDSSGYIDDSTIRDNSEEMYSLDNDSFLNSLEAMTIQNYWTDSVKHTKL